MRKRSHLQLDEGKYDRKKICIILVQFTFILWTAYWFPVIAPAVFVANAICLYVVRDVYFKHFIFIAYVVFLLGFSQDVRPNVFSLRGPPVDYEDVVFEVFKADYERYRGSVTGATVWNDEVHPSWWKWPPSSSTTIFNGAPAACPENRKCIEVSVAAVSLFLRENIDPERDLPKALTSSRDAELLYEDWMARPYTLCQLYSRDRPHRVRAWSTLTQFMKPSMSLQGEGRDSVSIFDEASDLMSQCRFVVAMEGYNSPGYVTEKIVNPFFAGAVPLYWGTDQVTRLFNPSAFFNLNDYEDVETAARALSIIAKDRMQCMKLIAAPIATEENVRNLLWWRY